MLKRLLAGSAMLALHANAATLPEIPPGCWYEIESSSLAASGVLAESIAGRTGQDDLEGGLGHVFQVRDRARAPVHRDRGIPTITSSSFRQ